MENMWLKATALGLGFQLVSVTSQMSPDPEFCGVLGIPAGEWELMGCAIGYPADEFSAFHQATGRGCNPLAGITGFWLWRNPDQRPSYTD